MTKKQALEEIVSPKVNELKKIFEECREEMEWKAMETNVYEEENREIDEKNINDKRATKSVMDKLYKKRLGAEERK
ncbi:hypothetical protein RhiirC2_775874 [Rhizophagus irregularis]|uniref:Uncharacterized protein n=1 Tax=Rhizophagus irregularis TaxID=588596 RepID=A0A2N1NI12_9GLOM|nr:hypothetical protein RhiirC2_775874 [Rhizophagus irregularis]